jgi:G6PDH family F420-dependent oxidoreductase
MLKLGYKLMSEEHGAKALVANARRRAEEASFDFAAISDHFSPWIEEQGHSALAWSVLGAISHATERLDLMTAVTCPTMRYHPAIIAQGAATLALLSEDRFTLGLGSGERLNEHVVGMEWPGIAERHEQFVEAIDIIQGLLTGEITNYRGKHFQLENARLFDWPKTKGCEFLLKVIEEVVLIRADLNENDVIEARLTNLPIAVRTIGPS